MSTLSSVREIARADVPSFSFGRALGLIAGSVVVGDSGVDDGSVSNTAVGETPNLAARLAALAEPGQIVVSAGTYRLIGNTFRIEDLGERLVKGISGPVKVYLVRDLTRNESRFGAARKSRYTPFVGREQEVALLIQVRSCLDG